MADKARQEKEVMCLELESELATVSEKLKVLQAETTTAKAKHDDLIRQLRVSADIVDKEQTKMISHLRCDCYPVFYVLALY